MTTGTVDEASPKLPAPARYTVAVRTLCEFTAKEGDLDLRFTPSPSAQQGIAGHKTVAARRSRSYQAEVRLSGRYEHLAVRGRADGYDAAAGLVEEVKTHAGDLARMPANHRQLHWAQAKVYGWLLCERFGLAELTVSLVYFDIVTQRETTLAERCGAAELRQLFATLCGRFLAWADRELAHRARRDAALGALAFPHAAFRPGQRELAEAVFRAARAGRCLAAQAPTGIGKTVGTIFPLLKAAPACRFDKPGIDKPGIDKPGIDKPGIDDPGLDKPGLDKIVFLSAKNSGKAVALDAIDTLLGGSAGEPGTPSPLRVLELVAREHACEHLDKACHGDACPLARGFYDRLPAARLGATALDAPLTRDALRRVALAHGVCPYWLGQELARWSDVIVADYNHVFDTTALLHALTLEHRWRVAVLVDEAHNLLERARAMYSAELDEADLHALCRTAPAALKKPLTRLRRAWRDLDDGQTEPTQRGAYGIAQRSRLEPEPARGSIGESLSGSAAYRVLDACPAPLASALQEATAAITRHLADEPAGIGSELLRFYFDALHFNRLLESFAGHSLFDVTRVDGGRAHSPPTTTTTTTISVRNVVPATFLAPRFAAMATTVLFSATLTPRHFYADTLGLPEGTAWLDVATPFAPAQLAVHVVRGVSTRFAERDASLAPIARLIAGRYAEAPGNYLAFFSSFDYLQRAAATFAAAHPEVPVWLQTRGMTEPERAAFLARFDAAGRGIGFAVLGGSFAEGIDLPGGRLIGAFIATLGLPQWNPVNEAMRRRIDAQSGRGYDYTYLFPGIRKVVQAAGRVIRTPSDRGSVHLIDDRYGRPEVLRLLPGWWQVQRQAVAGVRPAGAVPSAGFDEFGDDAHFRHRPSRRSA